MDTNTSLEPKTRMNKKAQGYLDTLCINTIRTLAMDAVQKADSGHPGTPMALAPVAYVLWTKFLRYNPKNPQWFNRDRFILSAGHASMLQYAMLFLTGYDLSLDDLKHFRQWGSKTPGHPEYTRTPGVDTTTGPLGQGFMNAVGMALHGGIRPYASTFFIFTDYARPAIRLAAMMELPVVYVMTHDSIGLGEDGPTHQPVEHLASFRAMPHICVIRPADANETAWAWRVALMRDKGPTMLLLTRQKVPIFDRANLGSAEGLLKGGTSFPGSRSKDPM